MYRKLYEIAADIVGAQASFAQLSPEALELTFRLFRWRVCLFFKKLRIQTIA